MSTTRRVRLAPNNSSLQKSEFAGACFAPVLCFGLTEYQSAKFHIF